MSPAIPTTVVSDLALVDFSQLKLPMLTIYDHPTDFPDHFVVRVWESLPPTPTKIALLAATLQEARAAIPHWFTNLGRSDADDPSIVESWV